MHLQHSSTPTLAFPHLPATWPAARSNSVVSRCQSTSFEKSTHSPQPSCSVLQPSSMHWSGGRVVGSGLTVLDQLVKSPLVVVSQAVVESPPVVVSQAVVESPPVVVSQACVESPPVVVSQAVVEFPPVVVSQAVVESPPVVVSHPVVESPPEVCSSVV